MKLLEAEELHTIISRGHWDRAVAILGRLDPTVAADVLLDLPHQEQENLFRRLPREFAAKLIPALPYYDAFILLHTLPLDQMRVVVERMKPVELSNFLDDLPEGSWQQMVSELPQGGAVSLEEPDLDRLLPRARPIIEARQIEKHFPRPDGSQIQVIAPITISLEAGAIVALLGPSGSGKSTLLRMLAGLTPASVGEVLWHGRPLTSVSPHASIVFQSFALFPWLTVLENVEAPLAARGVPQGERRRRASDVLSIVGLKGFETAYPKELSGGMKQRVGFARALAVEPEVLFMDEPFSALDVLTAENLRGELMELWIGKKIPTRSVFLVTHNIDEAVLLADRIIVLGRNPARVRADFRVPLDRPREHNSAEFSLYVDYIYKLMTQPELEAAPPAQGAHARKTHRMLPHAGPGVIAGLLELLNDRGGTEDLPRVAAELQLETDDLLPIVEAAVLLRFATSERGDIELTAAGKAFVTADIASQKALFRKAALAHATLLQQIVGALENKSDHSMPLDFFRDLLREHFSDEDAGREIETALNWGRYADIFQYDSERDRLVLSDALLETHYFLNRSQ
jgi:NitT/TauT family transport system ATP-binding protein